MTHQLTATPSAKATAQGSVYADAYGFGAQVWLKDHPTANTCPPTYVSIPDLVPGHAPPVYNIESHCMLTVSGQGSAAHVAPWVKLHQKSKWEVSTFHENVKPVPPAHYQTPVHNDSWAQPDPFTLAEGNNIVQVNVTRLQSDLNGLPVTLRFRIHIHVKRH